MLEQIRKACLESVCDNCIFYNLTSFFWEHYSIDLSCGDLKTYLDKGLKEEWRWGK